MVEITEEYIRDYIKKCEGSHVTFVSKIGKNYKVMLTKSAMNKIYYFQDEHLKDSHQLSDLVGMVLDILNEEEPKEV